MSCDCRLCRMQDYAEGIRHVRETVFVAEQKVPMELEWDGRDADAVHAVALDEDGAVVATGRLLLPAHNDDSGTAHIGRMAVLAPWRGRGTGSRILQLLCEHAHRQGASRVCLNAQLDAVPFYRRHGFVAEGTVFDDAGIPHRRMCRVLTVRG